MNEQEEKRELKFKEGSMKFALEWLRPYFEACPQMVQPEIGVEAFVGDLHKACEKFAMYFMIQDYRLQRLLLSALFLLSQA